MKNAEWQESNDSTTRTAGTARTREQYGVSIPDPTIEG